MKPAQRPHSVLTAFAFATLALAAALPATGAPATVLLQEDFNGGVPGWTAVQPAGATYVDGPMLWQYDVVSDAFVEQSNLYSDGSAFSLTRIAPMLINDTVAGPTFTYTARLTAGDDDGFGLIWGYENENTFYRVAFARQASRTGTNAWPFVGWAVDRVVNGEITDLFGAGVPGYVQTFTNTVGRPFDVTVTVNNSQLSITVTDDPLVAPTVFNLVTGGALPTSATGKVGIFSWGMGGNSPRGFRIENLALTPTPLAGDLNSILAGWTFVITPRADGTINMNSPLPPMWSMGFDVNGPTGTMIENSDTFSNGDNNAAGTTNYAAPTAVTGDVNWSNYLYSARLRSSDDDGPGLVFRYLNETNFYRIGFRSQNSSSGVKRGLSIQKNVDLNFDQIFASTDFIYQPGVPFDVHISIQTNRLQAIVVNNPASPAAQHYLFGPFDITGPTVDHGQVGVFSWAQFNGGVTRDAGTEVDSLAVHEITGRGLVVNSAYGTPTPPVGVNDFPPGQSLTASVQDLVTTAPGVRQVSTGWSGVGSVAASGSTNETSFTLDNLSLITWRWQEQFLLTANAGAGGTVSASDGPWLNAGSNVTVTATANPGFVFTGWSGDSVSTVPQLIFAMVRPVNLTATFGADSDSDSLPDAWETKYFSDLDETGGGDADNDGSSNMEEYLAGRDPNFTEVVTVDDGLDSDWVNPQRDPGLAGNARVVDFGSGFRGVFEDSNAYRWANDGTFLGTNGLADYVSFQGSRMILKPEVWNADWATNFSASAEISVGDNDGNCIYFRYVNESNWFRATICGEAETALRARFGLSVQGCTNGVHFEPPGIFDPGIWTDPVDTLGYKRVRLSVKAVQDMFEVRVIGWNALANPPGFDPFSEHTLTFWDSNLPTGRFGFGLWGQGTGTDTSTNGNPVPWGAFVDNVVVQYPSDGPVVFSENWETVPLATNFPAGWANAYTNEPALPADWRMSAHGTIAQMSNEGGPTTGVAHAPKADVDGPILLAPMLADANYLLEIGLHPFDNDGVGFVYDYQDADNFSRVIFVSEATANGRIPRGLSVSRKVNGTWTDIVAGDAAFVYTPGRPFTITFAANNGQYRLVATDVDDPAKTADWFWTAAPASANRRFGLTTWASPDAHFLYARALALPQAQTISIGAVKVEDGRVILSVSAPPGASYSVLRSFTVDGTYAPVATGQTGAEFTELLPGPAAFYRLQLEP